MPRANRYMVAGAAYHLTHRCHDRSYLLRFADDRNRYRALLRQELIKNHVSLLSYTITSNHVHLLVADAGVEQVARLMQAVQGKFAEGYNQRKKRQGAFWSDRYHATMIDGGRHLLACLRYIDLNMVRAGVVRHPGQWKWTAWQEICGDQKRYRLIDREALLRRLQLQDWDSFRLRHAEGLAVALRTPDGNRREPAWTEAIGVGDETFLAGIQNSFTNPEHMRKIVALADEEPRWVLREADGHYGLNAKNWAEKTL